MMKWMGAESQTKTHERGIYTQKRLIVVNILDEANKQKNKYKRQKNTFKKRSLVKST